MGVQILWSCGKMNTLLIAQVAGALECKNVRGVNSMIANKGGYIETDQFINEMKKRNLSLEDLILLNEQYERYNSLAKLVIKEVCSEKQRISGSG